MGFKRCFEANEFEDLPFNKAKRLECNDKLVSFAGTDNPNSAPVKPIASGKDEDGFYNIQWYDAIEPETVTGTAHAAEKDVETSGHFSSGYSEDGSGSGATSLPASLDSLEFDFPRKASVPLDDAYSVLDSFPRRQVPIGPNHQATIPVWKGRGGEISVLTGSNDVHGTEESLMGTCVISMPKSSFYSCKNGKEEEGRTECNCLDQDSIRCVRQHVQEKRENLIKTLGNETFMNLGFDRMGEEVAHKWSEEEEDLFHEIVYSNPATLGRNFWRRLSAAFPSRTKKEIVSYYYNVFMLRRRAAQNRSRFLNIDSDDDECPTGNNVSFFGFQVSEDDDSAIESPDDQDVHVGNQDNYSDDDGEDDNSDNGTGGDVIGIGGYDKGNSTDSSSQIESWSEPVQQVNETLGISIGSGVQDDSCMSFECQINMDEPCPPCGHDYASPALQAGGFKCDQSPFIPGILDFSSDTLEHVYFSEPSDAKDWYPGYSTGPASDIDFSATSKLIEEFLGQVTPDRKTKND
ncbi:uncharacterized protein LOC114720528 [Neltuma alba]|uniref:uncharacterized protein LOC114720528 n=1 Tax=Neltuma alba TaxID=207710 RepID=UPI0010A3025B|nr:uncharacterized protein LOC114720528 [Prosopis alba]